jgi:hypothetical protein
MQASAIPTTYPASIENPLTNPTPPSNDNLRRSHVEKFITAHEDDRYVRYLQDFGVGWGMEWRVHSSTFYE